MTIANIIEKLEQNESERNCYELRIERLQKMGRDPAIIKEGIADTLRVLESKTRSFVIYGEPQSGKTEFMIALVCKLLDLGKQTIFVIMNDNTELESQNFDRFHQAQELNPTPERDVQITSRDIEYLKTARQRVIFCRKNVRNLEKLIHACRFMKDRVVIDDEADYATPNAKINKADITAINQNVEKLGDLGVEGEGIYIGVTATPARLDLNNTFLNDAKKWVFLNSHENYKGRQFFFPATRSEIEQSDYKLVKLPNDKDDPTFLRHSVFRFLIRVAILNQPQGSEPTAYSMLIHTAGKTNDHEKDNADLGRIIQTLSDREHNKFLQYVQELRSVAEKMTEMHRSDCSPDDLVVYVLRNVGKSEVLIINHKNSGDNVRRAGNPKALFTFAIGGNIVSRGLTFENLLTFFFSRTVKGRLQQNTYIQRARMFGNRPYSKYFELCVPEELFQDWATVFQDHEISLRLARAGAYQHIQSKRVAVVDRGAIDNGNVTMEKSERPIGDIFTMSEDLENKLLRHNGHTPLTFIEELIEQGLLSHDHIPESLLRYLHEVSRTNESDVLLVLREDKGEKFVQNIERYKDGDVETITRPRGGVVHAMLNKTDRYANHTHFLLPIKNAKGKARFLYKSNIGQTILQNLRVS